MIQENTPAKVGLLELLLASSGVQFVIPAYQRNYTWTANREVKQLLDDIKAVLKGERNKHFIGIIIYLERSLDFSRRERSVIDGQQRLTTLFLSLYAVKELLLERGMEGKMPDVWKCNISSIHSMRHQSINLSHLLVMIQFISRLLTGISRTLRIRNQMSGKTSSTSKMK